MPIASQPTDWSCGIYLTTLLPTPTTFSAPPRLSTLPPDSAHECVLHLISPSSSSRLFPPHLQVIDLSTSKTGKHGHAKVNMVGTDIFTGKKVQDICPASHNMTKPVVSTKTYTVLDVTDDDFCSLMDADGDTREDIVCPGVDSPDPKLGEQIREGLEAEKEVAVVVTSAMGQDAITNVKFVDDEA